jgi:hypothetical protein
MILHQPTVPAAGLYLSSQHRCLTHLAHLLKVLSQSANRWEVRDMESTEVFYRHTCSLCEKALGNPWFKVKAYRYAGLKLAADVHFHLCQSCYPSIHSAIAKAVHERLKQISQDAIAKLKQDYQVAVKI